ncbi:MAG: L,D-transpeptidase family protein [Gemmatimonadetes bacterium]|nr:L,D-transpeptidase family protein [Gemmatimonadota bacterium]
MKPRTHFWSGVAFCALLLFGATTHASAQASLHLASTESTGASRSSFTAADYAIAESGFAREQLRNSRVRRAQVNARPVIQRLFKDRNLRHPAAEVFVRVFKRDRELEVWVRSVDSSRFQLLKTYGICAAAGKPGPKRRQGDEQVPEGFYHIDLFNPNSNYHLSMRVNYPNASDRAANPGGRLGGDIYIHGDCVSAGCLAMTDEGIEELYWLGIEAHAMGQSQIPIHIFPARLDAAGMKQMKDVFADQPDLLKFWKTLQPGYEYFEKNQRLPQVMVDAGGTYRFDG